MKRFLPPGIVHTYDFVWIVDEDANMAFERKYCAIMCVYVLLWCVKNVPTTWRYEHLRKICLAHILTIFDISRTQLIYV